MKRVALLSVVISLVISCAVPTGAVFASEESVDEVSEASASQSVPEEVAAVDEPLISIEPEEIPLANDLMIEEVVEPIERVSVLAEPESESVLAPDPPLVIPPPVVLPVSPLLITAYKVSGAHMHAVQFYNNSSNMVPIDGFSLLYIAGGDEYEVPLVSGWIEPRSYIVIAWQGESEYADIEFRFDQIGDDPLESIELHHPEYQLHSTVVAPIYAGALLHRFKSAAGNYTTNVSFAPGEATISGGGLYELPGTPELSVLEILVNPRDCTYGYETPYCYDYIKVRNNSSEPLDLSLYRLRSGYSNTSSTATNTAYFDEVLGPGEVLTLTHDSEGKRVSFSANDGTVWLEDVYGFTAYDLEVPPYVESDLTAQTGRSWAFNETTGQWQWATPAPFEIENDFTPVAAGKGTVSQPDELVPCRDNQYRSEETNRCRSIVVASALVPCREGQYRSEETNRCRSIAATAASVLKPCADDQFRNPDTNRCRKIASADDVALADCGEGRERNPETNRCRNVLGVSTLGSTLPFPVEETADGAERFAGWWTLGIITALGIGYGVWEWREELAGVARRAAQFARRSK